MSEVLQATYWLGTLAVLIVSFALFLKILGVRQEKDEAGWWEECQQRIEMMGVQTTKPVGTSQEL